MKKTISLLIVSSMAVFITSCGCCGSGRTTQQSASNYNPHQGEYSGKNTVDLVRDSPVIKEYNIRPYVHPNNPNVRMPGGSMFVVNRPGRYNTEPLTRNGIVVEPQYASVNENVYARKSAISNRSARTDAKQAKKIARDAYFRNKNRIEDLEKKVNNINSRVTTVEGVQDLTIPLDQ